MANRCAWNIEIDAPANKHRAVDRTFEKKKEERRERRNLWCGGFCPFVCACNMLLLF
jgi:hypothetical protein